MANTTRPTRLTAAITAALLASSAPPLLAQVNLADVGNTASGFQVQGTKNFGALGLRATGIGDINGDGLADVALGEVAQYSPTSVREVLAVFARASGSNLSSNQVAGGANGFVVNDGGGDNYLGTGIAGAGDFDGDGLVDLIVGNPFAAYGAYDCTSQCAGATYVVFGAQPGGDVDVNSPGSTFLPIYGSDPDSAYSGFSVSGIGDFNGDGLDDVIIGTSYEGADGKDAFIVFGRSSRAGPILLGSLTATDGVRLATTNASSTSIGSVAGAGDFNGDGLDDVIVSTAGGPHIIFGQANPPATIDLPTLTGAQGVTISGATTDSTNTPVAGTGDFNGDGFADVIIGAPGAGNSGVYGTAGKAFVLFGSATPPASVDLDSFSAAEGLVVDGADYSSSGIGATGIGDVDGDGLSDAAFGASYYSPVIQYSAIYVVFGRPSGGSTTTNALGANTGGFRINPENSAYSSAINHTSAAGDVSGDGLADIVIGDSALSDGSYSSNGRAYVLFSGETPPPQSQVDVRSAAADASRRAAGVLGDGSAASTPAARAWIDFADGSGTGPGNSSLETITLNRSAVPTFLGVDSQAANVHWEIVSNRSGFSTTEITLKYLDSELGGLMEGNLGVFRAPTTSGPWTAIMPASIDTDRNQATLSTSQLGFFTLGVAPEVALERDATPIADSATDDVMDQDVTAPVTLTYTIRNLGTADMTVAAPVPANPVNVVSPTITALPSSPVPAGGATTFDVTFDVAVNGPFGFDLSFTNGDADENPYDFTVTGNGINGVPDIDVARIGGLPDGGTDALGNQDVNTIPISLTYDVTNTGQEDLALSPPILANLSNIVDAAISSPPASTVAPGGMTSFEVSFEIAENGPFAFDIDIPSDDPDESPYAIAVTGTGINGLPEVELGRIPVGTLADGSSDAVGNQDVTAPVTLTYDILNLGKGDLSVSTPVPANPTNASGLTISSPPASLVPPGGITSFDVTFAIDVNGAFGFDLSFANSDGDENPYDVAVSGNGINGVPEVELRRSGVGIVADGATDAVGDRDVTGPVTLTYTVQNLGQDDLTVATPAPASFTNVSNVAISSPPTSPVPPGGFTTFDVTFDVDVNGAFGFDLSFANSDADENPYDVTVSGDGINGVPEVELRRSGVGILADGATDAVGDRDVTGPVTLTYTVQNLGQDDLTVATPAPGSFTNVSNVAISSPPTSPVPPGGATTFDVTFDVDVNGAFGFDLSFANGDADENPYDLAVSGNGINGQPEIGLSRLAALADNGSDDLGDTLVGPVTITYQVDNVGQDNLNLGGVSFANDANVSDLGFDLAPTTTVPPGGSTSLAVDFNVLDLGPFSFDLALANDDADEDPYDLTVLGTGTDIQEFPADPANGDLLGSAVASFGNLFAVGVPGTGNDPGQVLVYRIEGNVVILEATIDVPDGFTAAQFGASLDLEGDLLAVGAPGTPPAGAKGQSMQAAIFQRVQGTSGANWNLKTPITSPGSGGDAFGASVALSGSMMVVGAPSDDAMGPDAGMAYVFGVDPQGSVFSTDPVAPPSTDAQGGFGAAVAADKGKFGIGAPNSGVGGALTGSVSLFEMIGQNISPQGTTTGSEAQAGDQFGASLSLGTGQLMIVGAPGADSAMAQDSGAAYLFNLGGDGPVVQSGLVKPQTPESNGSFGAAVGVAGNTMAIGSPGINSNAGGVFVFDSNSLLQTQFIEPVFGQTGFGSAISFDVLNLLIGAPTTGSQEGAAFLKRNPDILFQGRFEGL